MALNWAYKHGFTNVIIAGIDLVVNTEHFDKDTTPDQDGPTFNDYAVLEARRHLVNVAGNYLKIYQLNPNNDLELEKIEIKELLENDTYA